MTDLNRLQEACKLIDNYSDVIETIRNSPDASQREIAKKLADKYSNFWLGKIIDQLKSVGLISRIPVENTTKKYHQTNDDAIAVVEKFSLQFAEVCQM